MSEPNWPAAREAILGNEGELLLRFMRDMFFHRAVPAGDRRIISLAERLGWIATDAHRNAYLLTPQGALVADSAREYCNWLDEGRALPSGVVEAQLRGKAVLDIGCGFGRHVFSASRVASLAVGLEPESAYLHMSSILRAREGVTSAEFACALGEKTPFTDEVFDVIFCTRSLHYMDARAAISEMARIARPGARIFLVVATFGYYLEQFLGGPARAPTLRERIRTVKEIINSVSVMWTGRTVFGRKGVSTTASHVLLTANYLAKIMADAGLRLVGRTPSEHLFVAERVASSPLRTPQSAK